MQQQRLNFGASAAPGSARRRALSVSELTARIQGLLEGELPDVWVEGEISNLTRASSGHFYFSLKDEKAQVRAVVWRTAARLLRLRPREGLKVLARGQLRVYAPRGEYQLAVEVLEPLGKGALQQAFEDLKQRLDKEGLFDPTRKRALPMLPRRIGVVTSPTGAVIQDIVRVLSRRYANLDVLLYPARVQGREAAAEIIKGIQVLNRAADVDVLIVARGGGSLEDLWPFNEEALARALAASRVPTISAVGHETDFTIADFVADVRAPTPSAAAEFVVQAKQDLSARVQALDGRARAALTLKLSHVRARVAALTAHRVFASEQGRLQRYAQSVDELRRRAGRALAARHTRGRERWQRGSERITGFNWGRLFAERRQRLGERGQRLAQLARAGQEARRERLARALGLLENLSPLAVLSRGYAVVAAPDGGVVRTPDDVALGDDLSVQVHGGVFGVRVTSKEPGSR